MSERGYCISLVFLQYEHAMWEEADDADCQSTSLPGSRLLSDKKKVHWLYCMSPMCKAVHSMGHALPKNVCGERVNGRRACVSPSWVSFITPPVICFVLDHVSHCISAGGSNVALCIYTLSCNPEGPRFDLCNSQCCVCVCVHKKSTVSLSVTPEPYCNTCLHRIIAVYSSVCVNSSWMEVMQRVCVSVWTGEGCQVDLITLRLRSKFKSVCSFILWSNKGGTIFRYLIFCPQSMKKYFEIIN